MIGVCILTINRRLLGKVGQRMMSGRGMHPGLRAIVALLWLCSAHPSGCVSVRPTISRIYEPGIGLSWSNVQCTLPRGCQGGLWGRGLDEQEHGEQLLMGLGSGLAGKDASGRGPLYCSASRKEGETVESRSAAWMAAITAKVPIAARLLNQRPVRLTHYGLPPLHVNKTLTFWGNMLAGAVSRSCAQTAMHPANVIKTLLQTKSEEMSRLTPRILSRGAGAQFVLSLPHGALSFAVLEAVKSTLSSTLPLKYAGPAFDFLSSAMSTTICSVISTPQMVLTDRIMAGYYPNLVAGVRQVLRQDGFKGLYAGWFAALAQKIPSYGLTWVFFQQLKEARTKLMDHEATNTENFVMGAVAAAATVCVMMPLDTIKTRIVTQAANPNLVRPYKNLFDCGIRVMKEEGFNTFYHALAPRLASVVPMIGIQFGVYEFMRRAIRKLPEPVPVGTVAVPPAPPASPSTAKRPPVRRRGKNGPAIPSEQQQDDILSELLQDLEGDV